MKLSESVKPISYIKAHASEVVRELEEKGSFIITLNGEAKGPLQDIPVQHTRQHLCRSYP